ncbi:ankyrin repeat domain-containing protein [Parafrankia sp. BMG5.11]|uniref:ankyrin repeat domain-containing protein n=1 Tax=Parafrankia sp. BMG5.11 TaxID=222540 RepID=UPI001039D281|nr:ankyrin repeat domain-containing protein [Parafrankia sp. BMG5.11]TCJ41286.1 ankyrin repeat domain-containing protein [Parafrankia sp. BMG5.11]
MFRWLFGRKEPQSAHADEQSRVDRYTTAIDQAIRSAAPLDAEKVRELADEFGEGFSAKSVTARAVQLSVPYTRKGAGARMDEPVPDRKQSSGSTRSRTSSNKVALAEAPARQPRGRQSTVYLGVYCTELRYDEEDHAASLPSDFAKARREWEQSRNDPESPHYAAACNLLSNWFVSEFSEVDRMMSFSLEVSPEGRSQRGKDKYLSPSESFHSAFANSPRLTGTEVVALDFRETPLAGAYRPGEPLVRSPDVAVLAIYEAKLNPQFGSADKLPGWLRLNAELVKECFSIGLKPELLERTEIDEDGDEITFSGSSWEGGEILFAASAESKKQAREILAGRVRRERAGLFGMEEEQSAVEMLLNLGDVDGLRRELDGGLDANTRLQDDPLLKTALIALFAAEGKFSDQDEGKEIRSQHASLEAYRNALRRNILALLEAGADVNQPAGEPSIITIAEVLDDPEITPAIRTRSDGGGNGLALAMAAESGDVERVRELLDQGTDVDASFVKGITPLIIAAQGPGGEGEGALAGAQRTVQEAIVKLLLERGANVNAVAHDGNTALGNAVRRGNTTIAKILLDAGATTKNALPGGESITELARRNREGH